MPSTWTSRFDPVASSAVSPSFVPHRVLYAVPRKDLYCCLVHQLPFLQFFSNFSLVLVHVDFHLKQNKIFVEKFSRIKCPSWRTSFNFLIYYQIWLKFLGSIYLYTIYWNNKRKFQSQDVEHQTISCILKTNHCLCHCRTSDKCNIKSVAHCYYFISFYLYLFIIFCFLFCITHFYIYIINCFASHLFQVNIKFTFCTFLLNILNEKYLGIYKARLPQPEPSST